MKQDPHIIYIITKLELGGAQKVCLSIFNDQQNATLITGRKGPLVAEVIDKPNVILMKELTREVGFFGLFNEFRCFFALVRILRSLKKKYRSTVVHTHSTKAGLLGRWAALFAGIKTRVHTVHGYAFHAHQNKLVWFLIFITEWFTSLITTHFICVSSADVKTGIRLFPRFAKKHSIIRAAVNFNHFLPAMRTKQKLGPSKEPFIFGTIACFKPQKNLFDLLQAFESVYKKNSDVRLEIIGDGQLRPALEAWIAEHTLINVITLHGWQENVAPIMAGWHAFVLTSLWEGLPCAIVEARLQKLPVISYNTGGIHDVIMHGENGLLYAQKEWKKLANGMLELTKNKELYAKLKMYEDELEDFSIRTMTQEHRKLYYEL